MRQSWRYYSAHIQKKLFGTYLFIDFLGIGFYYKGDEVTWLWPWKRTGKLRWLSTNFEAEFSSLKEIDLAWEDYFRATYPDYKGENK